LLIESKDEDGAKVRVDFDDKNSWEYLFKLYWLDVKGKHLLTLEELISAKSSWTVRSTSARREKEESSDERYDANNDHDASSDSSSRKRKRNNSLRKRGRKRQNHGGITARKCEISIKGAESLPKGVPIEGVNLSGDTQWASQELLEFIGHMRNGDKSHISQFDVQVLLLEYIKQNNLRDPRRKSQIICDTRLSNLFRKPRVGHFEMLKLLEMHFHVRETPTVNGGDGQRALNPDSAQVDCGGYSELPTKLCSDKRRKTHKKIERDPPANLDDYAAIDMHNINLIYLRRSLMEDLIDDVTAFSEKITGAFVRIRISGVGQKQDMYRLVKVLGTHKVAERYNVGKKTTDCALEISNLDKKEVITMDTISNQDFTEEECKRLRQSMKLGLITRLKVGDIQEKAKIFQSMRVNDWLENEKQRLSHLCDRASETGRRKELRECVEKLQLLNTPEERSRRINEVPEVHIDSHMAPNYESAEEWNDKTSVDWTMNRNGSNLSIPGRKAAESNSVEYPTQKCFDASHRMSLNPPTEGVTHRPGAGSNMNLQSANGWNIPRSRIDLNNTAGEAASVSSSGVVSNDTEPEKVWHYKDPSGNVQGPFTLSQLSMWTNHFPRDMRIWLTFESEENSLLLSEVLPKQQKDFIQPVPLINNNKSTWTGTGEDRSNSSMAENMTSPIGYNVVCSPGLPSQSADCSPRREGPNLVGGALPSTTSWEPLKDAQNLRGQTQHQANYSCAIPSSASSYGPPGSHGEGMSREKTGERNNCQDTGGLWSPTPPQKSHCGESTMEPHPGTCTTQKHLQNDSKSNSRAGFVENLNTQMDFDSQRVPIFTPRQSETDLVSLGTSSPSEFKTACQQEGTSWSLTTKPTARDGIQFSAKPESRSPSCPVEGRDSDSASSMPTQSGAPACSPQSTPSICTSNSSKTEETRNLQKACPADVSNAPVNQPPEPKIDPVLSPGTQDQYPSPTRKLERKEASMNKSGSTFVAPEDSATKAYDLSSVASVSEISDPPAGKIAGLQLLKETSGVEQTDLKHGGSITQTEQLKEETTAVKRENIIVDPVSDAEEIAVSDVLESLTEQNCGTYNLHGAMPLESFTTASAEEERPQCSSPIALSPWGEPSYYQGEAVDSALWGVQDDQSNDMWSLSSPTPALQPSSGLGADGKDTSCIIEEVIVAQGNSAVVELSPTPEERKTEKCNSSASTGCGVPEQVKPKPSVASSSSPRSTKAPDGQPSGPSLEESTKAPGGQPSGPFLEGSTKTSSGQQSGPFLEGSTKASGPQPSGSGWGLSLDGSAKASGWGSSLEGSAKASGWLRSSSSPEGRKAPGWPSLARESSRVNSTWSASQNRNSSSSHQAAAPIAKNSSEAPRRQGNTSTNTAGWGEALGNNKSWHSSSGNASRGSQSSQHHDRYSQGNDSWRGSSQGNESRRGSSNHSRRFDHRQDHGSSGSSRLSSRGQSQRGICKYYESGHCRKGSSCYYLHR
jgi:chromatin remodeling complex protein RSC6